MPNTARQIYCRRKCARDATNAKHNKKVVHDLRTCGLCADSFMPKRSDSTYCSPECSRQATCVRRNGSYAWKDNTRDCVWCGDSFRPVRNDALTCSAACGRRRSYALARDEIIRKSSEWNKSSANRKFICAANKAKRRARSGQKYKFSARDWRRLVNRFSGRCAYCDELCDNLTLDHVVPVTRGGSHGVGNILPACPSCNFSKQDKLLTEWRLWRVSMQCEGVA